MRDPRLTQRVPRPGPAYRALGVLVALLRRALRWRVEVRGGDRLPRRGPAVLAWLHHGHLDVVAVGDAVLRATDRPIRPIAARELWTDPRLRPVLRLVRAVPVDRGSGVDRAAALAEARAALAGGALVAVAPEGRIATSFDVEPFRTGVARLAADTGAPVVIVAAWGAHRPVTTGRRPSWRRSWRLPVTVAVAPPVHVPPDADPRTVTVGLERVARALLHPVQEDYPDGAPAGAWWVPARLGGGAPVPPDPEPWTRRA